MLLIHFDSFILTVELNKFVELLRRTICVQPIYSAGNKCHGSILIVSRDN